jgi:hypothetical protein
MYIVVVDNKHLCYWFLYLLHVLSLFWSFSYLQKCLW